MATVTVVPVSPAVSCPSVPRVRRRRIVSWLFFLSSDVLAIAATGTIVLFLQSGQDATVAVHRYLALWPFLPAIIFAFACFRLYPGIVHNAVDELRRMVVAITLTFLAATALLFANAGYSPAALLAWWAAAMVLTPCLRSVVRDKLCHRPWWGEPVAVFRTGDAPLDILRELQQHPEIGLRPVVIFDTPAAGLPVLDRSQAGAVRASGVDRALILVADAGSPPLLNELESFAEAFPRLMIVHHGATLYNLTVDARSLRGRLAVEVRRDLLLPLPRMVKRALDIAIVLFGLPMVTLIILLLALLVRLESPGPVFYAHPRIGRGRTSFRTWKLRTMLVEGEAVLQRAFAENEALRQEWLRDHKLRRDPRVTRVGRFLRKTSLDELPQFWNVLRGEMSLVGPRPIVEDEVAWYGQSFSLYCRVTPGLTGLWQVSGRSSVGVSDRVRLDSYYVRNWSPWLDLHILARTAKVVFTGQGAW